jgi:ADP-heptose:LPS heptosyltransferase
MKPEFFVRQWEVLKITPDPELLTSLSDRIASTFIDRYVYNDEYERQYIDLLCDMASCFDDPELNQIASRAFFGIVVERLCDDFEGLQVEAYNRLISQVISTIRLLADGVELNAQLERLGLLTEEEIYQRVENNCINPDEKLPANFSPEKVIVLSRVTIGADVAINSVICQRVGRQYPEAEIIVVGSGKLIQVMADAPNTTVRELGYTRRGGLIERFKVWIDLLKLVEEETSQLAGSNYLVLDPDSRLTQLGVLPVAPASRYRFFNSRGKTGYPDKASISELTNIWLNAVFGEEVFCHPKVWLHPAELASAGAFQQRLLRVEDSHIVCVNLGVGGNARKCLPVEFEVELILRLLEDKQVKILLDMGFGEEEQSRNELLLRQAEVSGILVARGSFSQLDAIDANVRLAGIECTIGEIACLIRHSDEFIGYDSACQHIAAALGVRACTVFAGSNNVRFIRRWRACGANVSEIVCVDTPSKHSATDVEEVVARVLDCRSSN